MKKKSNFGGMDSKLMKTLKSVWLLLLFLGIGGSAFAQKKGEKTVVFYANVYSPACQAKLEKAIRTEKGVKDWRINLPEKKVTITFREKKNTEQNLREKIASLQIRVKSASEGNRPVIRKPSTVCYDLEKKDCPPAQKTGGNP